MRKEDRGRKVDPLLKFNPRLHKMLRVVSDVNLNKKGK